MTIHKWIPKRTRGGSVAILVNRQQHEIVCCSAFISSQHYQQPGGWSRNAHPFQCPAAAIIPAERRSGTTGKAATAAAAAARRNTADSRCRGIMGR